MTPTLSPSLKDSHGVAVTFKYFWLRGLILSICPKECSNYPGLTLLSAWALTWEAQPTVASQKILFFLNQLPPMQWKWVRDQVKLANPSPLTRIARATVWCLPETLIDVMDAKYQKYNIHYHVENRLSLLKGESWTKTQPPPPKSDLYHTPSNLPQLIFILSAPGVRSSHLCTSKMGHLTTRWCAYFS